MSLRQKTFIIIISTLIILILLLVAVFSLILLDSFGALEQQSAERNLQRALNALSDDLGTLTISGKDWAYWDETNAYLRGENERYAEDTLIDAPFIGYNLNLVLLLNDEGEILHSRAYDLTTKEVVPLPQGIEAFLQRDHPLMAGLALPASVVNPDATTGIILLPDGPMLVVALPVLDTEGRGPSVGMMIWGRFLDDYAVANLSELTRQSLRIETLQNGVLPGDFLLALEQMPTPESRVVRVLNQDTIAAYAALPDINGEPAALLRVDIPRDIYHEGQRTILYLLASLMVAGLVFGGVVMVLLEGSVISRVTRLNGDVARIGLSADSAEHVQVDGEDEIAGLSKRINAMVDALRLARHQSEQNLKTRNDELEQRVQQRTAELTNANTLLRAEIQEREKAQVALQAARDRAVEALQFKNRVLANISHDVRTPLNVITGYVEILQDEAHGTLTSKQNDLLARINWNAGELQGFINNLLDYAQMEMQRIVLKNAPFTVSQLVEEVVSSLAAQAEQKGLSLVTEIDAALPPTLVGDVQRLKQVLLNLVENALKFTEQGSITIRLHQPDAEHWALQVRDTGLGISPTAQYRVFEPFWQVDGSATRRNNSGVGLGLSIVQELSRLMQGEVHLESEIGSGSTFTVVLPLLPAPTGEVIT
ncbi:MAG: CHASE4 domain-containing protein [bacterium]|nr:CHASE4 domain-containing protein [bacterium]